MPLSRPILPLLVALAAFAAAALMGSQRAEAAEPGVVPDLTWYTSDADKLRTAGALQHVGSKWVRLNVQWKEAEPADDNYNEWWIAEYQKAVALAKTAGQRVIVMVDTAPAWASGSNSSNVPRDPAKYAEFMRYLAGKLGSSVDAYEVWNEPNLKRFWSTGPDAAEYTKLLKAAYPAIKQGNPAAKVIFGGLSTNDYAFLERAYAAGAKGYFDVMGTHPYPYCGSTGPADTRRENGRITRDSFVGYREIRASMVARGDAKPIWVTEFGWNTASTKCDPGAGVWQGGVSEAKQAEYLYEAFKMFEQDPYVEVALWYDFRNNYWMNDEDSPEARYGLLRTDFSPKPAYHAFRAYTQGDVPSGGGGEAPAPVKTDVKIKKVKPTKRRAMVKGQLRVGLAGSSLAKALPLEKALVRVRVERRRKGAWRKVQERRLGLQGGLFRKRVGPWRRGSFRVQASFEGIAGLAPSKSRFVRFRVG